MTDQAKALIKRAELAASVDDECAVIRDAVFVTMGSTKQIATEMLNVIFSVKAGQLPRSTLLGVVASLVSGGMDAYVTQLRSGAGKAWAGNDDAPNGFFVPVRSTPAMALLIAILEAQNG